MSRSTRCPTCGQRRLPEADHATTTEAAAVLGVSVSTIRTWCLEGRLPYSITAGGHRRIARSALVRFAAEREAAALARVSS